MMVASQKTMDALKSIGLNKYERNLWAALLSRGTATAGELADISKVPRSRCYDVLESLSAKGFIMLQPGKPLKYVSLAPKEALERAKTKILQDAKESEERMETLAGSDAIKELERLHKDNIKTTNADELNGSLKGRSSIHQQIGTMLKNAKKSVKLITTETGLTEIHDNHISHFKRIAGRGVKIHILAPVKPEHSEIIKNISKYAQVKDIDGVSAGRVCIVDSQEFVMGLTDDVKTHPTQDVAFWSQSGHAGATIIEPMFDSLWTNAKAVK